MRVIFLGCALLIAACSTPCQELARKICACEPTTSARSACERRAAQVENTSTVDQAQQDFCERHVDGCDCNALDTAAGKVACGLAECTGDAECASGQACVDGECKE